ncbi:hypothetical protein BGW39_000366 [Mortierella sp. 14UC]|nr:hypothetical protein BGW39_000366 [Mortierella sp. 14UC]
MPTMIGDAAYFDDALRIVSIALHGRINHTAQTSLANDILCVAAGLRSAALVEQLYLNPNDVERIESMFHHTTRFNHLDLLSIGNDHIFIIHRTLLLHDINEYLSESEQGLHRVFVNIDYLLSQPEIMRIQCWDQAELCHLPLPAPDYVHDQGDSTMTAAEDKDEAMPTSAERDTRAAEDGDFLGLSMVTLSGWLLGYPVNYVLPTTASMKVRKRAAKALKRRKRALNRQRNTAARQLHYQQPRQQGMEGDQVLPAAAPVSHDSADCSTYVDDGNMSDDEGDGDMLTMRGAGRDTQANELDNGDDDEEEENDSSHNSLANRLLVLTQINLSANEAIHGLHDHCLLSFSYPSALLDRYSVPATGVEIASSAQLPSAPASPLWFTGGYEHSTTTSREVNPFETSLLSNSNGSHGAAGSSYSTTMHGALPPTPPSILTTPTAAPVPSSSYPSEPTATTATAAPVVPSIIQSLLSTHLAPPPMV